MSFERFFLVGWEVGLESQESLGLFHPADAGRGGISGNLDQGQQIAMLEFKHEETEKLALQKALQHGVFAREALDEIPFFFVWRGGLRLEVWI